MKEHVEIENPPSYDGWGALLCTLFDGRVVPALVLVLEYDATIRVW